MFYKTYLMVGEDEKVVGKSAKRHCSKGFKFL